MLTYRKTKSGEWVVFGPAVEVKSGTVTVNKKDGTTKQETILSVGKSFDIDGKPHAYGKIAQKSSNGYGGCSCSEDCCRPRCYCDRTCNCKGGNIYDC